MLFLIYLKLVDEYEEAVGLKAEFHVSRALAVYLRARPVNRAVVIGIDRKRAELGKAFMGKTSADS